MQQLIKRLARLAIKGEKLSTLRKYYINYKFKTGAYDQCEKETAILKYLVKQGDTVLDIGANIGMYTRLFSKLVGTSGSVHAFEPVPLTYEYLIFNIDRERYKNVITYNNAVSDKIGICSIILPDIGTSDIYQSRIGKSEDISGKEFLVPSIKLDFLYPHCFSSVDFIKCDVEGAELLVLKGAKKLLEENKPKILCEIGANAKEFGYTSKDIFSFLANLDYNSYFYDNGNLIECVDIDFRNSSSNYLFLPKNDLLPL